MEHRNNLMLELLKLMATLSTATIGFLVSTASTVFKESHVASDFYAPIGLFFFSILFSMLAITGLVDRVEKIEPKFKCMTDKNMFIVSWGLFLFGLAVTSIVLT